MPIYSNIIIFAIAVFLAGDPLQNSSHSVRSLESGNSQSVLLGTIGPALLPSRGVRNQQDPSSRLEPSDVSHPLVSQSVAVSTSDAPFLRRPILFEPNSLEPGGSGRTILKQAAAWLREHPEARVLIVGSCDPNGSETCTHAVAERRGAAIQTLLQHFGITSDQFVGVKGWDNADRTCQPSELKCQQSNRSVRIFMARSATPGEKP